MRPVRKVEKQVLAEGFRMNAEQALAARSLSTLNNYRRGEARRAFSSDIGLFSQDRCERPDVHSAGGCARGRHQRSLGSVPNERDRNGLDANACLAAVRHNRHKFARDSQMRDCTSAWSLWVLPGIGRHRLLQFHAHGTGWPMFGVVGVGDPRHRTRAWERDRGRPQKSDRERWNISKARRQSDSL